ncbi:hypothetical protein NIES4071_42820 [Calothrix sp. NIES-4071]|nr:hypothetical protein NIES4071_42820 [Calothrix sp. NIES-4071]BAZ58595.1 hypothetical protein NIES4105_42740 [Calothrix sp. NIES-4105]
MVTPYSTYFHFNKASKAVKVTQILVIIVSGLTILFIPSGTFAGSSRQTLDGGTVIITCNNNTGRTQAQFQLNSSVGTIGTLDFDLIFNNGEHINVTKPTQIRRSITGFRDAMGLASQVTTVGQAFGFDNEGNIVRYGIPAFNTVCDNNF